MYIYIYVCILYKLSIYLSIYLSYLSIYLSMIPIPSMGQCSREPLTT